MSGLRVLAPGLLSLIQDAGRRGHYQIGLTDGGPVDPIAFNLCNRLLQNAPDAAAVEVSFGGLQLRAETATHICVTGAAMPLTVNGVERPLWQVLRIATGDEIHLGYASAGCRAYLGVAGGFTVTPEFGSVATVVREGIGGLNGDKIAANDVLPCADAGPRKHLHLPVKQQPRYQQQVTLRVIPGYQQHHFSRLQQRRFFGATYTVSDRADRMGYRLEGPSIRADISGILSEGICHGAIQIPADGQPIVLLNDRQTIGGYPKIGAALSLDVAKMAQLTPGGQVVFTPVSQHAAHNALHLGAAFEANRQFMERKLT